MSYDTTQDDRLFALMAYLLSIFTWIVAPLVIFLVKKDTSRFVAFHAMQCLFLHGAVTVIGVAAGFLGFIFMHLGPLAIFGMLLGILPWLAGLAGLVFTIVSAIKAFSGEWYKIPILGDFVPVKDTM